MVKKNDAGKSLFKSQEYVIDSDSDGLLEVDSSLAKSASIAQRGSHAKTKHRNDRVATSENVSSAKSPQSKSSASGEQEVIATSSPSLGESSVQTASGNRGNTEAIKKLEKKRTASTSHSAPITIAARPFRPPNSFREVKLDEAHFAATALESLSADAGAKQVWHIAAPSSVPIASIKELNVDAVSSGKPILTHDQRQYGFSSGPSDPKHLLLPAGTGNVYKRARTVVSKSFYLRQIQNRPHVEGRIDEQPITEPHYVATRMPPPKAAPAQPELLKMRYKPFGVCDVRTTSASVNGALASGETERQAPLSISSPPYESRVKKEKMKKKEKEKEKKVKQPDPTEQSGLADDTMEIHDHHIQPNEVQPSSSSSYPTRLKMPVDRREIDEEEATSKKKKKRKKLGDGSAS